MIFNQERTTKVADELLGKLNQRERDGVIDLIDKFRQYKNNEITYNQLDEILLFTGNKVKETAYRIQETMYDGRNAIRLEFEVVQKKDQPEVGRKIHG